MIALLILASIPEPKTSCVAEVAIWACEVRDGRASLRAPMTAILTSPQLFDGYVVDTSGLIHFKFEDHFMWIDQDAQLNRAYQHSLWIDADPSKAKSFAALSGQLVSIRGVFRAGRCGHMGLAAGYIEAFEVYQEARRPLSNTPRTKERSPAAGASP